MIQLFLLFNKFIKIPKVSHLIRCWNLMVKSLRLEYRNIWMYLLISIIKWITSLLLCSSRMSWTETQRMFECYILFNTQSIVFCYKRNGMRSFENKKLLAWKLLLWKTFYDYLLEGNNYFFKQTYHMHCICLYFSPDFDHHFHHKISKKNKIYFIIICIVFVLCTGRNFSIRN